MPFIYIYQEASRSDCVKIGYTKERRIWDRFRKHIPCNPRLIELRAAFQFDTEAAAKNCEAEIKRERVRFPRLSGAGTEWYALTLEQALAAIPWQIWSGRPYDVLREVRQDPLDTLNRGDDSGKWALLVYVLLERRPTDHYKLALTAYNWPTVEREFITGNPYPLQVSSRWRFSDNESARLAYAVAQTWLRPVAIHSGWFKGPAATAERALAELGGRPFDRDELDARVHYTRYRRMISHNRGGCN